MQEQVWQTLDIKPVQLRTFGLATLFLAGISTMTPGNLGMVNRLQDQTVVGENRNEEVVVDNIYILSQTNLRIPQEENKFDLNNYMANKEKKEKENTIRNKVSTSAFEWLGVPYKWGGQTKSGVDCSAMVQKVFKENGVILPRTSFEQFRTGVGIAKASLKEGDLVFFSTAGAGASHVGIFVGEGKFISATRNCVEVECLDDSYWSQHYRGSRRIINS